MAAGLDHNEQREVGRKARLAVLDAVKALGGEGTRHEILERAIRDGGFTPRELAETPPPPAREKHDSYVAYRLSWALTNLKSDGLLENPRWSFWQLAGVAQEGRAHVVAEPVSTERLAVLRAMPASQYRKTPEWTRTRAAALERAGHRCSMDRRHTDRLEVHHNTYERVGAELASDLVVLCHSCHQLHHHAHGRPRRPKSELRRRELVRSASVAPPSARSSTDTDKNGATSPRPTWSWILRILGS